MPYDKRPRKSIDFASLNMTLPYGSQSLIERQFCQHPILSGWINLFSKRNKK